MAGRPQDTVNINTLSLQQLSDVKTQLNGEIEHLTSSHAKLTAAQSKFRECAAAVKARSGNQNASNDILVPLTSSLYVRGRLSQPDRVIIDVGTGFYVEKDLETAAQFYTEKAKALGENIKDLEAIVSGKTNNLRAIEEVLRQRILAHGQSQPQK